MGPVDFLLNRVDEPRPVAQVVEAPAFSLTKVMAIITPLLAGGTAVAARTLDDVDFNATHVIVLIVAVVAFLAVTMSADLLSRGIATASEKVASQRITILQQPLKVRLSIQGGEQPAHIVGVSNTAPASFLCLFDNKTTAWVTSDKVVTDVSPQASR